MNARQRRKVRRSPEQAAYRAALKKARENGQKLNKDYKSQDPKGE